ETLRPRVPLNAHRRNGSIHSDRLGLDSNDGPCPPVSHRTAIARVQRAGSDATACRQRTTSTPACVHDEPFGSYVCVCTLWRPRDAPCFGRFVSATMSRVAVPPRCDVVRYASVGEHVRSAPLTRLSSRIRAFALAAARRKCPLARLLLCGLFAGLAGRDVRHFAPTHGGSENASSMDGGGLRNGIDRM